MHVCVVKSAKCKQGSAPQHQGRWLPSFYAIMAPNELKCTCSGFYFIILCMLILTYAAACSRRAPINLGYAGANLKALHYGQRVQHVLLLLKRAQKPPWMHFNLFVWLHAIKGLKRSYFCMLTAPYKSLKHPCATALKNFHVLINAHANGRGARYAFYNSTQIWTVTFQFVIISKKV